MTRNTFFAITATVTILAGAGALIAGDFWTAAVAACSAATQIANIG